ncbi:MAG: alpha-hydroxy acid oxidase [SAR324 cluster bacterium]|nr:alpha-hydroxy acid oxidase [SAR324 cluster bacterium]HIF68504.1 alpha-hydroxy-acid oxidizing protein [Candidatus Lambdaproteobacteria bacterium]
MSARFHCLEDFRTAARCRLPRLMFDFIDGAAGSEFAAQSNIDVMNRLRLLPRVLVNVVERSLKTDFLGQEWRLPFGIAPMGMCDLAWAGTDRALAKAAVQHEIPLCLSIAASSSIETTQQRAGKNSWFQLYVGVSLENAWEQVQRAQDAGYKILILTVDVPQVAQRIRDLRNGFQLPFRIGPKQFMDFARHPRWVLETLRAGVPRTANYPDPNQTAKDGTPQKGFVREETRGKVDWAFLQQLRERWPGKLVVKGVLAPQDAVRIQEVGADAIYVSNHGGRQLDSAPPAITRLPLIREAVGTDYPLLFDSGIRNGEAVVKALALGANFVMLGRPFLYASGADGERGVLRLVELLSDEISLTLAQLGCNRVEELDPSMVLSAQDSL